MGIKRKRGSVLGEAMYEVDFIKARRLVKGQLEYLIKWKGFDDDKYDTWEGLANLSGLEPDLATFEAQQKRDQEDYVKQMAARKAAKAAASGKGGLRAARSSAAVSAAAAGEDADGKAAETEAIAVKEEGGSTGRKKAVIWTRYKGTSNKGEFQCQELNSVGGICGAKLKPCGGPSSLWNHHRCKHKTVYMDLKNWLRDAQGGAVVFDVGVSLLDAGQATIQAQPL